MAKKPATKAKAVEKEEEPDEQSGNKPKRNQFRDKSLSDRWAARIKSAQGERGEVLRRGANLMSTIRGAPNEQIAKELQEKFKQRTGVALYYPVPMMPSYVNSLIPTILRQSPRSMIKAADPNDKTSVGIARCQSKFLDSVWTDSSRLDHNRLAVMQALSYGVGALLHDYDVHAKRPTAVHLDTRCLLLDRFGTQAPSSMSWIGYERVMPIDVARELYDDPKLQPNLQALSSSMGMGRDSTLPDPMAYPTDTLDEQRLAKAYDTAQTDAANEKIKVVVIYERAGTPDDESIPLSDLKRDPDDNGGFSGKDRKLTFDAHTWKLLAEEPWGFTLNRGDFPITLVWPTIDPEDVWSYSLLDPVRKMQDMIDLANSILCNNIKQASRIVYLVNETMVADGPNLLEDLKSGKQFVGAKVVNAKSPDEVFNAKFLVDFDESTLKLLSATMGMFDTTTNRQGLMSAEGLGYSTATGAEVAQRRTQTSVANPTISVERALREQMVKDVQIAWSKMSGEDAKVYCGSLIGEEVKTIASDGKEVVSYAYWPENPTIRDIRSIDVWIQPNSTLETSGAERARTIMELIKTLVELVGVSASLGLQVVPEKYASLIVGPVRTALRELDMPDVEEQIDSAMDGLFQVRPDAMPPDEQAALKGEVQQGMEGMAQQFGQALQQMQEAVAQQLQQISQNMQVLTQTVQQQGQGIAGLAQAVTKLAETVQRHEVALGGGAGMIQPAQPSMPINSVGGLGAEPGMM